MPKHRYLTCDLSNLTASCSVSGGIYRDVLVIPGLTPVPMRSVPPDSIAIGPRSAGLRTRRGDRFGGIEQQTENFDQFKLVDGILGLAFKDLGFDDSPFEARASLPQRQCSRSIARLRRKDRAAPVK